MPEKQTQYCTVLDSRVGALSEVWEHGMAGVSAVNKGIPVSVSPSIPRMSIKTYVKTKFDLSLIHDGSSSPELYMSVNPNYLQSRVQTHGALASTYQHG